MGKALIIKGADFSSVAVAKLQTPDDIALLTTLGAGFYTQQSISAPSGTGEKNTTKVANTKRSCVYGISANAFVSKGYNKITFNVATGYDIVVGVGTTNSSATFYAAGDCVPGEFDWITTTQTVTVPISATSYYVFLNFRHDDNTTVMSATGVLTDCLESVELK